MRTIPLALKSLCLTLCLLGATTVRAQQIASSTDVPRTISYQGLLSGPNGVPVADGEYRITLSLYSDPTGTIKIWQDTYRTTVIGGIFNLYLGNQNVPLPDPGMMNKALWIGTQVGDGPEMHPLTPLSASPYAFNVPDRAITTGKLADGAVTAEKVRMNYIGGITVNGQSVTGNGTVVNIEGSDDLPLTYNNETNTLRLGKPTPSTRRDQEKGTSVLGTTSDFWTMRGDGRTDNGGIVAPSAGDWIGSSNAVTFEMRTNNQKVMRYQPSGTNTPNIVGGYSGNGITSASVGSVIGGGGESGATNQITTDASFAVIGGGEENLIEADRAVIGGGSKNKVYGWQSVIAGGDSNTVVGANSAISGGSGNVVNGNNSSIGGGGAWNTPNIIDGTYSFIGAGSDNTIEYADENAIVAGSSNTIHTGAGESMIGSGVDNEIHDNTFYSFIGSGLENQIMEDITSSGIGSGDHNTISASHSFIGSGDSNIISSFYGFIGAGNYNTVSSQGSFIGGGTLNTVSNIHAFIGSGTHNAASGSKSFIGSGIDNIASGNSAAVVAGRINSAIGYSAFVGGGIRSLASGDYSVVDGGQYNQASDINAAVGGGTHNTAAGVSAVIGGGDTNTATADRSFIGGGGSNSTSGDYGAIGGGEINAVSASYGFVGGGRYNIVSSQGGAIGGGTINAASNLNTFVGSGSSNTASGSESFVGGGTGNWASGQYAAVAGGSENVATGGSTFIGGGNDNVAFGQYSVVGGGYFNRSANAGTAIGGGSNNTAAGAYSTIPGGDSLQTTGYAQTAVGFYNASRGSLTAQPSTPTLKTTNDPLFMVGNGTAAVIGGSVAHSNAFEVSYNGHSVVYDVNGSSQTIVPGTRAPIKGSTYVDNVMYAWGDINANGTINADFGVANVVNVGLGSYIVTIRVVDPQTGAAVVLLNGAVTATLTMPGNAAPCGTIVCSRLGNPGANQFQVRTFGPTCSPVDLSFMFHVTGRP